MLYVKQKDQVEAAQKKQCEHSFKLVSSGWRHVETYKCTKCGEEKHHHWND